ncbi:hypothetical protein ACHQM5_025012 [Ranunculus cassubicifolius]
MGNLMCVSSAKAYVFDTKGRLKSYNVPITAGKLIYKKGCQYAVICSVQWLRSRQFVVGMTDDANLVAGEFYVMVSIDRDDGKLEDSEMQLIEDACKSRGKTRGLITQSKT